MDVNSHSVATGEKDSNTNKLDRTESAKTEDNTSTEPAHVAPPVEVDHDVLLPPLRKEISRLLIQDWDEVSDNDEALKEDIPSKIAVSEVAKVDEEISLNSAAREPTDNIEASTNNERPNSAFSSNNVAVTEIEETKHNIEILSESAVSGIQGTKDNIEKSLNTAIFLEIKNNTDVSSAVPFAETKGSDNISLLSIPAKQPMCVDVKDILQAENVVKKVDCSFQSEIINNSNGQSIPEENHIIVPKKEYDIVTIGEDTSDTTCESSLHDSNVDNIDKKVPLGIIHEVLSQDVKTTEDIVIVSVSNMPSYESEIQQSVSAKQENINVINLTDDSSQSEWDKALGILEDTKSASGFPKNTDLAKAMPEAPHTDNNNSLTMQEKAALDRKQLLDILEGNEDASSKNRAPIIESQTETPAAVSKRHKPIKIEMNAIDEHKIALKQLTALPRKKRSSTSSRKKNTKDSSPSMTLTEERNKRSQTIKTYGKNDTDKVVQTLVDDWEEVEIPTAQNDASENANEEQAESVPAEDLESEQTLPPRRMSRIIKKKVIFDPDNPDSFPSTSTIGPKPSNQVQVSNEVQNDVQEEITNTSIKKKIIAPPSKGIKNKLKKVTKWAKPQIRAKFKTKKKVSKDLKKRKSEVDRLLMDEGAVDMIYQVELGNNNADVPVSKHSKKNIKSRAAIIKKAVINQSNSQNSTSTIKLFRIRNVEKRGETHNQKKVVRTKSALRESMKSPSPCDEFTTDANASIIVRRHSSSSYTSSICLSPRRLSDVEPGNSEQASNRPVQLNKTKHTKGSAGSQKDVFSSVFKDGLDRKDCLSLKEKLNSKLSNVLNFKRKSDSTSQVTGKNHKVRKEITTSSIESIFSNSQVRAKHQKGVKKNETPVRKETLPETFTKLSTKCENNIMHIIIKKTASENENLYNLQTLQELQFALHTADESPQANITLLTSEDGTLCGGLDLSGVLSTRHDKRLKAATEMADSVRSLLLAMESHKNLLCVSVSGRCVGLGLGMLVLGDLAVASRDSTFCLYAAPPTASDASPTPGPAPSHALPAPGLSVLMTHTRALNATTCSELLLCGTKLNSDRARQVKLVTRVLPVDNFEAHLLQLLAPLAAESAASLSLKKQLLRLAGVSSVLRASVDRERDVLLHYWLSAPGQDAILHTQHT